MYHIATSYKKYVHHLEFSVSIFLLNTKHTVKRNSFKREVCIVLETERRRHAAGRIGDTVQAKLFSCLFSDPHISLPKGFT